MRTIPVTMGAALLALSLMVTALPAQADERVDAAPTPVAATGPALPGPDEGTDAATAAPTPDASAPRSPFAAPSAPLLSQATDRSAAGTGTDTGSSAGTSTGDPAATAEEAAGGRIHGIVFYLDRSTGVREPEEQVLIELSRRDPASGEFVPAAPASGSDFTSELLEPGDYLVHFVDQSYRGIRNEYYDDALYEDEATLVSVTAGQTVELGAVDLEPKTYWTYRYGGADRYEVAANISLDAFAPGVPVLYIASGESYPDALSAGPAAARQDGALLLVMHDRIPDSTRAAILALEPQKIVVVGGTSTVQDSVLQQLAQLQPDTIRVAGADRYESSRLIVDYAFCGLLPGAPRSSAPCEGGARTLFVATGANFPDALAAGPAAAHVDGAVLLVPGTANELGTPTVELLSRLGTADAHIAGGYLSVNSAMETRLQIALPGRVDRYNGANRYEVAAEMNRLVFRGTYDTVLLASGEVFADALSGGPSAATIDAPLYLVQKDCLPESMWSSASALDPIDFILLGGPNTLSDDVENLRYLC